MFTLPGTPIIYYGDEFAKVNDEAFYAERVKHSGYSDSRYFVRGRIDWHKVERELQDSGSLAAQLYSVLQNMIRVRKAHPAFSRGSLEFVSTDDAQGGANRHILSYRRQYEEDRCVVIQNLSSEEQKVQLAEFKEKNP